MSNNIKSCIVAIMSLLILLFLANTYSTFKTILLCAYTFTGCVVLMTMTRDIYLLYKKKQTLRRLNKAIRDSEHKGDNEISLLFTEYILINEYKDEEIEERRSVIYMIVRTLNKEYNLVPLATLYIDGHETLPQLIQRSLMIK